MYIDEIQVVMDAISTLGEAGKFAFIWWLIADKVLPVIGWLLALGVFAGGGLRIVRQVLEDRRRVDSNELTLRTLRDLLRIGSSGHVSEYVLGRILQRVTQLVKEER